MASFDLNIFLNQNHEKGGSIMAMLVCSAQKCVYNDGMYCSKGDIKVGGENATKVQETCCTDSTERTTQGAKSSMGTASQKINVACEACRCVYNDEHKCTAGQIGIAGAGACTSEQTECGTFRCNCGK